MKTGKMVNDGRELKTRLANLENELKPFQASSRESGKFQSRWSDIPHRRGQSGSPQSLPVSSGDCQNTLEAFRHRSDEATLWGYQETKESLGVVQEQLRASGINLV